jgi:hypothetical protein
MLKRIGREQLGRAIIFIRGNLTYAQGLFLALFRCGSAAGGENDFSRDFLLRSDLWSGGATTALSSAEAVASAVIAGPAKRPCCSAACTFLLLIGCPSPSLDE